MTIFPKRVWTKKGIVFHDKKPVRQLGDKVGVYDPNFTEVDSGKVYPEKAWENVPATDELLIYDGEQPTEIGTFEDGLESTYQFVDYDGTVLKSGKVKDGETPVAPADPTREHYTFTGWNPAVGPITKNTTFSAVYAIDTFTVNIGVNDPDYGDVSISSLGSVPYGTAISASDNVLTIGETTITATAETGYQFSSWGTLPATVTENLTITASFEQSIQQLTFNSKPGKSGMDYIAAGSLFYNYSTPGWDDGIECYNNNGNLTFSTGATESYDYGLPPMMEIQCLGSSLELGFNQGNLIIEVQDEVYSDSESDAKTFAEGVIDTNITWDSGYTDRTVTGSVSLSLNDDGLYVLSLDMTYFDTTYTHTSITLRVSDANGDGGIGFNIMPYQPEPDMGGNE